MKINPKIDALQLMLTDLRTRNEPIRHKAASSSPFLSNEILTVSKLSSPAETFEFFLMICLTLYPFLTASSEILYPVFPDAPVIAIFMIKKLI